MQRAYFPGDGDLRALCKGAGVDEDFDKDGVALVFANVQEGALKRDEALGMPVVRFSPFEGANACNAYFVFVDPATGAETHSTREHPNIKACYDTYYQIARERALKEAALLQGMDDDVQERQRRIAQRNLVHQRALLEAELYFKETIGNPAVQDIEPGYDPGTVAYWKLAPRDIKRVAKSVFEFDVAEEPYLAWVVRLFLAHDLPPRWKRAENAPQIFVGDADADELATSTHDPVLLGEDDPVLPFTEEDDVDDNDASFVYTPVNPTENDLVTPLHPGITYFRGLLKAVREEHEIFADEDDNESDGFGEEEDASSDGYNSVPERRGILLFWHTPSQMYYQYGFADNRAVHDIVAAAPAVFIDLRSRSSTPQTLVPPAMGSSGAEPFAAHEAAHLSDVEARRIALAGELDEVWRAVETHVPRADLEAFASFVNVKLCGPETEFLRELALSLLVPLPASWIRTQDPEGRIHYCNTQGALEHDLWRESLQDSLPRWVCRAIELGHPVKLRSYEYSRLHPDAEACRDLIAKERTVRRARAKRHRILQRQLLSEQMQVSRRQLVRGETTRLAALASLENQDPMKQAYEFYMGQIGDPAEPELVCVRTTSGFRSPQMLFEEARRMGVKPDDLDLLWIPHMRLAIELPPGWSEVDEGSFFHEPSGLASMEHPAEAYFRALLEAARAKRQQVRKGSREGSRGAARPEAPLPHHAEYLEMIDHAGSTYYFNPRTMRKQLSVPPLTPKMGRHRSSSCLSTSRMSTHDPHAAGSLPGADLVSSISPRSSLKKSRSISAERGSLVRLGARLLPLSQSVPELGSRDDHQGQEQPHAVDGVADADGCDNASSFSDALARMIDENSSETSTKRSLVPPPELMAFDSFDASQRSSLVADDAANAFEESIQSLFGAPSLMSTPKGQKHGENGKDADAFDDDDIDGSDDDGNVVVILRRPPLKPKVSYFVQDWIDEQGASQAPGAEEPKKQLQQSSASTTIKASGPGAARRRRLGPLQEPPPPAQASEVESAVQAAGKAGRPPLRRAVPLRLSDRHPFFFDDDDVVADPIAPEHIVYRPPSDLEETGPKQQKKTKRGKAAPSSAVPGHFARVLSRRSEVDKLIDACARRSAQFKTGAGQDAPESG